MGCPTCDIRSQRKQPDVIDDRVAARPIQARIALAAATKPCGRPARSRCKIAGSFSRSKGSTAS